MRTRLEVEASLVIAFLAALAGPNSASAQDLAGTWAFAVELDAASGEATFEFAVDGNTVTGTYSGALGDQEVTGTIEGSIVRFEFWEEQVGNVTFEGTIDGTSMSGACVYGLLGPGTFTASKSKVWSVSVETV